MGAGSKIEWTDRTWNPLTGCRKVSPGCEHCYAKAMHERFNGPGSFDTVTLHRQRLGQPLHWRKPSHVFVNSMSDLFHQDAPDYFLIETFGVMASAAGQTFQVLTKRHARMRALMNDPEFIDAVRGEWARLLTVGPSRQQQEWRWPLPNVWLGVSVENQQWADIRIPALLDTAAAVRFLSCEPLLGPLELSDYIRCGADWAGHWCEGCTVDWVIAGWRVRAEGPPDASGLGARVA
jgi:protein gp37